MRAKKTTDQKKRQTKKTTYQKKRHTKKNDIQKKTTSNYQIRNFEREDHRR